MIRLRIVLVVRTKQQVPRLRFVIRSRMTDLRLE
jgi:hypothetical protein